MSHVHSGPLATYNSLTDPALCGYFANTRMRRHLKRMGLITRAGEIVSENTFRQNMARKEHKKHIRELLSQGIVHKTLDLERMRQIQIKRKLEEIAKIELVRRVKADRGRRGDEDILPYLVKSPRPATVGLSKRKAKKPKRPLSAPSQQLDQQTLQAYKREMSQIESGEQGSPYILPQVPMMEHVPAPPPGPKGGRGKNKAWPSRAEQSTSREGSLMLHRMEPAVKQQEQVQTLAEIEMHYFGSKISNQKTEFQRLDPTDEVMIIQQHCGGNTLTVFREKITAHSNFSFVSRRHRGFPFSLTFYINNIMDSRLSTCCEYKHQRGARIGGKAGRFAVLSIEGASPCYKCQVKEKMKEKEKKPPKVKEQVSAREDPKQQGDNATKSVIKKKPRVKKPAGEDKVSKKEENKGSKKEIKEKGTKQHNKKKKKDQVDPACVKHDGNVRELISNTTEIEIKDTMLSKAQLQDLCEIIRNSDNTSSLVLVNCNIDDAMLTLIVDAITNTYNTNLKALNLSNNKIKESGVDQILKILKANPMIKELVLKGNPIQDSGMTKLVDGILKIKDDPILSESELNLTEERANTILQQVLSSLTNALNEGQLSHDVIESIKSEVYPVIDRKYSNELNPRELMELKIYSVKKIIQVIQDPNKNIYEKNQSASNNLGSHTQSEEFVKDSKSKAQIQEMVVEQVTETLSEMLPGRGSKEGVAESMSTVIMDVLNDYALHPKITPEKRCSYINEALSLVKNVIHESLQEDLYELDKLDEIVRSRLMKTEHLKQTDSELYVRPDVQYSLGELKELVQGYMRSALEDIIPTLLSDATSSVTVEEVLSRSLLILEELFDTSELLKNDEHDDALRLHATYDDIEDYLNESTKLCPTIFNQLLVDDVCQSLEITEEDVTNAHQGMAQTLNDAIDKLRESLRKNVRHYLHRTLSLTDIDQDSGEYSSMDLRRKRSEAVVRKIVDTSAKQMGFDSIKPTEHALMAIRKTNSDLYKLTDAAKLKDREISDIKQEALNILKIALEECDLLPKESVVSVVQGVVDDVINEGRYNGKAAFLNQQAKDLVRRIFDLEGPNLIEIGHFSASDMEEAVQRTEDNVGDLLTKMEYELASVIPENTFDTIEESVYKQVSAYIQNMVEPVGIPRLKEFAFAQKNHFLKVRRLMEVAVEHILSKDAFHTNFIHSARRQVKQVTPTIVAKSCTNFLFGNFTKNEIKNSLLKVKELVSEAVEYAMPASLKDNLKNDIYQRVFNEVTEIACYTSDKAVHLVLDWMAKPVDFESVVKQSIDYIGKGLEKALGRLLDPEQMATVKVLTQEITENVSMACIHQLLEQKMKGIVYEDDIKMQARYIVCKTLDMSLIGTPLEYGDPNVIDQLTLSIHEQITPVIVNSIDTFIKGKADEPVDIKDRLTEVVSKMVEEVCWSAVVSPSFAPETMNSTCSVKETSSLVGYISLNDVTFDEFSSLSLVTLDLGNVGLTKADALCKLIEGKTPVESLSLEGNDKLPPKEWVKVFKSLNSNKELFNLFLAHCNLSEKGAQAFTKSALNTCSLQLIDFKFNNIPDSAVKHMLSCMKPTCKLRDIILMPGNNVNEKNVQAIKEKLKSYSA